MKIIKIIFLFLLFSCSSEKSKEDFYNLQSENKFKSLPLSQQWIMVSDSIGGCLVGGEYCYDGKCGGEGCCLNENEKWGFFLQNDKSELTQFLIAQLTDTSISNVHACPFSMATHAELAVYCLQQVYKVNWYDLDEAYSSKENSTNLQTELQNELGKSNGLQTIIKNKLRL